PLGGRFDGGPTSWNANILTANTADSYREFMIELADFQHAYQAGGGGTAANPVPDPAKAVNPPRRGEVGLPFLFARPNQCPGGVPALGPEAISSADVGGMVFNSRNEPVPLRVRDPQTNQQAAGDAGDLSGAFISDPKLVVRADPLLRVQPNFYPPLTAGVAP